MLFENEMAQTNVPVISVMEENSTQLAAWFHDKSVFTMVYTIQKICTLIQNVFGSIHVVPCTNNCSAI